MRYEKERAAVMQVILETSLSYSPQLPNVISSNNNWDVVTSWNSNLSNFDRSTGALSVAEPKDNTLGIFLMLHFLNVMLLHLALCPCKLAWGMWPNISAKIPFVQSAKIRLRMCFWLVLWKEAKLFINSFSSVFLPGFPNVMIKFWAG